MKWSGGIPPSLARLAMRRLFTPLYDSRVRNSGIRRVTTAAFLREAFRFDSAQLCNRGVDYQHEQ